MNKGTKSGSGLGGRCVRKGLPAW